MTSRYGIPLVRAKQSFEPAVADDYEAEILAIKAGAPVLLLHNVTYSDRDRPVVQSKDMMRGDRVRYYVELSQPIPTP
jgi:GntR family transcriptional regulator